MTPRPPSAEPAASAVPVEPAPAEGTSRGTAASTASAEVAVFVEPPEPSELRLRFDGSVRLIGHVLLGGAPLRLLRLSDAGRAAVEAWQAGAPVRDTRGHRDLAARLIDAGAAHPVRNRAARFTAADVTIVVPVRDGTPPRLPDEPGDAGGPGVRVVVVDDGSAVPVAGATVRHERPRGPAAARNSGAARVTTPLVAFLDADTRPEPGWLAPLLAHLDDPRVAAVAPRVRSTPGTSRLARYEQARSSLDLGPEPATVRPGARVGHVPSAALLARREHAQFDEELRFGEDVDLVWRLVAGGHAVRYEPASVVWHDPRPTWRRWLRQRHEYGTSAAALGRRHGRAIAPARLSRWTALAWALAALGRPTPAAGLAAGAAVAAGTAALLPRTLPSLPWREAARLALRGHLGAGRVLADLLTRTWGPVAVPLLLATRRGRWLVAAALARHLVDWARERPPVDPATWVAARTADDLAYGAGVWSGCVRRRTVTPLVPDLADWPGRGGATTSRASDTHGAGVGGPADADASPGRGRAS